MPHQASLVLPSDPLLNRVAAVVAPNEIHSAFIQGVIDRMLAISAGKGHGKDDSRQMVGLAAVQLGVGKRIITIDLTADGSLKTQQLQVLINPRILEKSSATVKGREGCWSCGNVCGIVERAQAVTVAGIDREGRPLSLKLHDFVARIAQHETDHLQGIRFPDRIPTGRPERLHWVEPTEFAAYREDWPHWTKLCPRERWEAIKAGATAPMLPE